MASLAFANGCVGVTDQSRWNHDRTARGKFQRNADVPQNEMSTFGRIESHEGGDAAPPTGVIGSVSVRDCHCMGPNIERASSKRRSRKIANERGVVSLQASQRSFVPSRNIWGIAMESL